MQKRAKNIIKGAYWIIQRFLIHYQIFHFFFSLLLPIKLSLFQLLRQHKVIPLPTIATAIVVALTRS
jgi:hypothetical protein